MIDLNENVERFLKQKGKNKTVLADLLGVSYMQLYRYLHGNITLANLERLAKALDLEPWQLLRPADQDNQNTTHHDDHHEPHKAGIVLKDGTSNNNDPKQLF